MKTTLSTCNYIESQVTVNFWVILMNIYEVHKKISYFLLKRQSYGIIIIFFFMDELDWQERDENTSLQVHIVAGSIAGITQHLSMIPVDNVKTHCQATHNISTFKIIRKIYQAGGLFNFYSGSSAVVAGCIPAHAIYFSIYQKAKELLNCRPEQDFSKFALVGALSVMFHDLIMTPTETLKQRLQLVRSENSSIKVFQVARKVMKNEGIIAFYRSFPVNYAMNIPFGSLIVMLNQKLKHYFRVKQNDRGFMYYFCGALAGGIASIPTCPLDVIKTKLNTQYCDSEMCDKKNICNMLRDKGRTTEALHGQAELKSLRGKLFAQNRQLISTLRDKIRYHNVWDTVGTIWKEDGIVGFFKGMKMRVVIQSVSSGVGWGTYHLIKNFLSKDNKY